MCQSASEQEAGTVINRARITFTMKIKDIIILGTLYNVFPVREKRENLINLKKIRKINKFAKLSGINQGI